MRPCPTVEPGFPMLCPQAQRKGQTAKQKAPSGQYTHGTIRRDKLECVRAAFADSGEDTFKYISDCKPRRLPC